ncbi:RNA polymerase II subunit B1 CTD phosphatase RTR1 [Kluyveromyces lactis]|uniref:RNA polymerase II subunit B1 CTD phosphatase RPAP2 homolog n=1 Tax=Kluyveromyces lactis (strain ATCC 8585 / CBS 2359 / DSM 70799 / NBRC 1267 / NRRL Y-1140 / WM37) TaxID=284590 RepID=Q6CK86_KLULA|nr:uncharacterized protein KLLA0_F12672g [Kluyveromyces lactis]CAG98361.1 KLLA0F12672p [Kluyveromyces lactis]|eukprot:XP_455653.1 uncharacterized protein KLLA0_F12672g [Kluyveromyces lactis]
MATIEEIKEVVLKPYTNHRQLTIREVETISINLIDLLITKDVKDARTMKYISRFLTKQDYADLVQERNLVKRCGYPLCSKSQARVRDPFADVQMTNFLRQNNPYAYLTEYCTKAHFRCSQFYQFQLSDEALFARVGVHLDDYEPPSEIQLLEEVLARESDVKQMIRGMTDLKLADDDSREEMERDISDMLADIKIVEINEPNIIGDLGRDR